MSGLRKIVVIGPESTGKSTLSKALANALSTLHVPEYARLYLESIDRPYNDEDLLAIAKEQLALEDSIATQANEYLICDTDLYVLKVWQEASYNYCHRHIMEMIATRKYDLYLLAYIDVDWEDDPLREHPTATDRHYFYHQYRDIVMNSGVTWADIRGTQEERLQASLAAIAQLDH